MEVALGDALDRLDDAAAYVGEEAGEIGIGAK